MSVPIYIAFGANLGDPRESFRQAIVQLEQSGVTLIAMSGLWESPSWPPGMEAPNYINACARVEFNGTARELLLRLHRIEAALGRKRSVSNAPRTLDLDLIDFRGQCINAADIQIPHPRMMNRGFVLFPLAQIAPDWRHPESRVKIDSAISKLPLCDVAAMEYLGRWDYDGFKKKRGKIT